MARGRRGTRLKTGRHDAKGAAPRPFEEAFQGAGTAEVGIKSAPTMKVELLPQQHGFSGQSNVRWS